MNVRLMDQPKDFKKLGVAPERIEKWEDARRSKPEADHWEWWYFDAILDDGTAVIVQFFAKPTIQARKKKDAPTINFQVTLPDGKHYTKGLDFPAEEVSYGKDQCDLRFGKNYFVGDLKQYAIHVEPVDGLSVTLSMNSLSTPFRPGTAYFDFGGEGTKYYTWLCCVPKGEVTGTLMVDGKERRIHGYGYHDHQWGNFTYALGWNHWTWARQRFEDYTLTLFDMTASKTYGAVRFPMCYLEDKEGNLVFSNTESSGCQVRVLEEYTDERTGKVYPKKTEYRFRNGEQTLTYLLESQKTIDAPDISKRTGPFMNALLSLKGLKPSYARYLGEGTMRFEAEHQNIERTEALIYEFMYPGKTYKL